MPELLLKLYDNDDREVYTWYTYGNNKPKRRRIEPVKLRWYQKLLRRICEICQR